MAQLTTDHATIRRWVQDRGGVPATVENTAEKGEDAGILRIDFPDDQHDNQLATISWEEFFAKFDDSNLAFLHQDETSAGEISRFNKFVARDE